MEVDQIDPQGLLEALEAARQHQHVHENRKASYVVVLIALDGSLTSMNYDRVLYTEGGVQCISFEGRSPDEVEESGSGAWFPFHRVHEVMIRWWQEPPTEDPTKPGQYL